MKIQLANYEAAFAALPEQVWEAEVCADLREELLISVKNGVQGHGESFSRTTLYLRATGEKTAAVLTERLEEDPYVLMEKALEGAEYSQAETAEPMNSGENFSSVSGDDSSSAAELRDTACRMEQMAKTMEPAATVTECSIRKSIFARRVLNSRGLDRYLEHTAYLASLSLTLHGEEGKAEQMVSYLKGLDIPQLARAAVEKARRKGGHLPKVSLSAGTYPALLDSDVVRNMMIALWQCFSGERLHSGASAFAGMEEVAVPLFSLVDDPKPTGWSVDYSLDSQGTLNQRKYIVQQGKLIQPLHTLTTAATVKEPPTGNAGRVATLVGTTPIAAIPVPGAIYVEPGPYNREELLEQLGDGVYLTYSLDVFHSINIASGEFSIPCGGILYQGGKPVGRVDQLTIAGNLRQLLRDVAAVGNDLSLEEFMFYHNYSYGGPSLLLKELSFAGKSE